MEITICFDYNISEEDERNVRAFLKNGEIDFVDWNILAKLALENFIEQQR